MGLIKGAVDGILFFLKLTWVIVEATLDLFIPRLKKSVEGEIVLITGGGHGLGRELALQYASQGATVVCWDINAAGNEETVAVIAELGYPKAYKYTCNVADCDQIIETAKQVQRDVGDVTILINNAGIMPARSLLEHTTEEIQRVININLMAHFWTIKTFLPTMLKNNHGHIVNICSCLGLAGARNVVPYCASKFAVKGLTEALYQELRADAKCRVKVTNIQPYGMSTGLCKTAKIRYPILMGFVSPVHAAKVTMKAQRSDLVEITIPRYYLMGCYLLRLLPVRAVDLIMDFLDAYVESDLHVLS